MATESIKYVAPEVETKTKSKTFPRPGQHTSGVVNWLTTIDHKKIGIMYGLSALFFLIVGGIEALLIRSQLWSHNMEVLTNREYSKCLLCMVQLWFSCDYASECCLFNYFMPSNPCRDV